MKTTLLSTVIAVALATAATPVLAQADAALPLSGAAYRVAEQAFAAYERGDYQAAYQQSTEAIRLRPDVVRLRLLRSTRCRNWAGRRRRSSRRAVHWMRG